MKTYILRDFDLPRTQLFRQLTSSLYSQIQSDICHVGVNIILWPNQKNNSSNISQQYQLHQSQMDKQIRAPFLNQINKPHQSSSKSPNQKNNSQSNKQIPTLMKSNSLPVPKEIDLKMTFFKYSRIHYHYRLRFSTLFHATSLYKQCLWLLEENSEVYDKEYLQLICLYLSIKFNEIYYPKLHRFSPYFKNCSIDIKVYRNNEKKILDLLGGNLNVATAKENVDLYLIDQPKEVYMFAYYLLECSLLDLSIAKRYSIEEISHAIILIMCQDDQMIQKTLPLEKSKMQAVQKCAAKIATAKTRFNISVIEYMQRKYSKQQYLCVANRHVFIVDR